MIWWVLNSEGGQLWKVKRVTYLVSFRGFCVAQLSFRIGKVSVYGWLRYSSGRAILSVSCRKVESY